MIETSMCCIVFFPFKITASKILVTTGQDLGGHQSTSEVVDFTAKCNMGIEDCTNCKNWPNFPKHVSGTTSGLLGNTVMICGGFNDDVFDIYLYSLANECYSFTAQKATLITYMSVERIDAASIVLNDNTLWVTGGEINDEYSVYIGYPIASTEHVKISGSMPGPDLPMALKRHAMASINSTVSMVIGGWNGNQDGNSWDGTASTFYFNHIEGKWSNGPILMQSRFLHAAGIVTDELTNEKFVAVTGGFLFALSQTGNHDSKVYLDSSEILQDGKWVEGKVNIIINLSEISSHKILL